MQQKIVLATSNAGKLREFKALLASCNFEIVSQNEFNIESAEETGLTFVENAILKARHASKLSGLPAIADDSGIEVFALNGRPGIYSARFAGEDANDEKNNQRLLAELASVADENRGARYCAILVYLRQADDPTPIICEGYWQGRILREGRGEQGFGYDPLFFVETHGCTSAELDPAEKNRISHRAQAMKTLLEKIILDSKQRHEEPTK